MAEEPTPSHLNAADTNNLGVIDPSDAAAESMLAFQNLERMRKEKRRKRIIRIGIGVAVLAALAAFFLPRFFGGNNAEPEPTIATGMVYKGDFADMVSSSGATQPVESVMVTPEIDGIIENVYVEEGKQVNEGDLLLTIKNDELDKAVRNAELGLRTAQNGVNSAQSRLNELYGQPVSNPGGRGDGGETLPGEQVVSTAEDAAAAAEAAEQAAKAAQEAQAAAEAAQKAQQEAQAQAQAQAEAQAAAEAAAAQAAAASSEAATSGPSLEEIEAAKIALEEAQIQLESAQQALTEAQAAAAKREVKAPQSGTIIAMNATPGAAIGAGSGQSGTGALVQIADLSQMKVRVQVNEIDISKISVGQKAKVTFSALEGVQLDGEVTRISAVSEGTGEMGYSGGVVTYAVDLLIPKPDPNLKPGMTASVDIACNAVSNTLIVPSTAIMEDADGEYVNRVTYAESGEPSRERVSVRVVARGATEAAVSGQLEDGDMVELGGWSDSFAEEEMAVMVG